MCSLCLHIRRCRAVSERAKKVIDFVYERQHNFKLTDEVPRYCDEPLRSVFRGFRAFVFAELTAPAKHGIVVLPSVMPKTSAYWPSTGTSGPRISASKTTPGPLRQKPQPKIPKPSLSIENRYRAGRTRHDLLSRLWIVGPC